MSKPDPDRNEPRVDLRQGALSAAPRPRVDAGPTVQKSIPPLAWAAIGLLGVIWGGSFLSNVVILRDMGVMTTVAMRVTLASLALWAYVLAVGLAVPRGLRVWVDFAVMGFLNVALPFTLIVYAQVHVPSGLASILNAATAIFGVLVAALVFADERLTGQKAIGVALGFAGVATVIGPQALTRFDPTSLAQLALIVSSVSYGFGGAWARARLTGHRPQVAAAGMLTMSAAMLIPLAIWGEGVPDFDYRAATWVAMAYLSLIATAGAFLMYYRVMPVVGAGNMSLVTLLVSPVAILIGAVVLNETLEPRAYFGFAALAAGLLVIDGRILRIFRRV